MFLFHHFFVDTYWGQWYIFTALSALIVSIEISKKYHPFISIAWLSTIMSSMSIYSLKGNAYQHFDRLGQTSVDYVTAKATVYTLSAGAFMLMIQRKHLDFIDRLIPIIYFVHIAVLIMQKIIGLQIYSGLIANSSMAASFIAIICPLVFDYFEDKEGKITTVVSAILGLYVCQSSIGYVAFVVGLCTYLAFKYKVQIYAFILSIVLLFFGTLFDYQFISFWNIDRFKAWRMYLDHRLDFGSMLTGWGKGLFFILGPHLQKINHFQDDGKTWWIWAHSDVIQLLLEQGVLGVCLYASAAFIIFRDAWKHVGVFASLIAFGITSAGNYPFEYPLFILIFIYLLKTIYPSKEAT